MEPSDNRGWVVWAKLKRNHQFWAGMVVSHEDCAMEHPGPNHKWVYWFEDHRVSKVENCNIFDFVDNFHSMHSKHGSQTYSNGVMIAKSVVCRRYNFRGFVSPNESIPMELIFCDQDSDQANFIPDFIAEDLNNIRKKIKEADEAKKIIEDVDMEVEVELMDQDCTENNTVWDSEIELDYDSDSENVKDRDRKNKVSLKDGKVKISEICICCQEVCPVLRERHKHPLFKGLCCETCFEQVQDCILDIGEDEVHIYCTICATPGDMFICDNRKCCRVYCRECIEQFWNRQKVSEVQRQNPWICFLCTGDDTSKYLKINENWEENVMNLFKTAKSPVFNITIIPEKKKISVVSVNDGISGGKDAENKFSQTGDQLQSIPRGQKPHIKSKILGRRLQIHLADKQLFLALEDKIVLVALKELGLDISFYFASERRQKETHVSLVNHGNKPYYKYISSLHSQIKQLPVDLVIGGRFNDLCLSKEDDGLMKPGTVVFCKSNNGLLDLPKKGSKITEKVLVVFYEFFLLLHLTEHRNKTDYPLLWIFLCDANISSHARKLISRNLECDPIVLNARRYFETCHARLAWTNIPGMNGWLTSDRKGFPSVVIKEVPAQPITKDRKWIAQMEKTFGFPKQYTNVGNLNILCRQEMLGKSGNVVVLKKILEPLCKLFATK